jgi:hypothetical protein
VPPRAALRDELGRMPAREADPGTAARSARVVGPGTGPQERDRCRSRRHPAGTDPAPAAGTCRVSPQATSGRNRPGAGRWATTVAPTRASAARASAADRSSDTDGAAVSPAPRAPRRATRPAADRAARGAG